MPASSWKADKTSPTIPLTTFMAVFTLYAFGGDGVHGFAFAMMLGVVVGTYSSIAIAAPILAIGQGGGEASGSRSSAALPATVA